MEQLYCHKITKVFSEKVALNDVSILFEKGKIHSLLGENGAGKSTLASIICGDKTLTQGEILIDGKPCVIDSPKTAANLGIYIVRQHPLLAESLSIEENILLGVQKNKGENPSKKIQNILKYWNIELSVKKKIHNASGDERFYTALIAALYHNPQFLILDEPSSRLSIEQRKNLYSKLAMYACSGSGCGIIIITHSPQEASVYSDRITVLEKGVKKKDYDRENYIKDYNIKNNGEIASDFGDYDDSNVQSHKDSKIVMSVNNLCCNPKYKSAVMDISFCVKEGAVTIIHGVAESGLETLENVLTGMSCDKVSGTMELFGKNLFIKKLTPKILRQCSCAIISSDKYNRASSPDLTVEQLLTTYVSFSSAKETALQLIKQSGVNVKALDMASTLSGGMLQKLILERELSTLPKLLIMCEPLQGLDQISIKNLGERLFKLAQTGTAILVLTSTDFPKQYCDYMYNLEGGMLS